MSLRPPAVKQGITNKCWAACMEGWSYISWYWPNTGQDAFVQKYGSTGGALDARSTQFAQFVQDWNLGMAFYEAGQFTAGAASSLIDSDWGYFMFIEMQGPGVSHARLAYDVINGQIRAMEPADGQPDFIVGPPGGLGKLMILSPAL